MKKKNVRRARFNSKGWAAIRFNTLGCWSFIKLRKNGKPHANQPTMDSYSNVFSECITSLRSQGFKIPASGWRKYYGTFEASSLNDAAYELYKRFQDE